ncbi:hypothetical protein NQZ68_007770 [Dissostichus eleginoides]|nr:hypothetical protein NQZ68_007770 [Dissostichus eleginoides]
MQPHEIVLPEAVYGQVLGQWLSILPSWFEFSELLKDMRARNPRNTNRNSLAGREEISEPSLGIGRVQSAGHAQKSPASLASQAKKMLNRKNRKIVFQKLVLLRLRNSG